MLHKDKPSVSFVTLSYSHYIFPCTGYPLHPVLQKYIGSGYKCLKCYWDLSRVLKFKLQLLLIRNCREARQKVRDRGGERKKVWFYVRLRILKGVILAQRPIS